MERGEEKEYDGYFQASGSEASPPIEEVNRFVIRELAVRAVGHIVAAMTAYEVIDQIKALPPAEKTKVVEFVEHEIEEQLLTEETPAMLAAIDDGVRSLDEKGGRDYTRDQLEQKVRQWARGGSR